jgi:bacillithiol synthase
MQVNQISFEQTQAFPSLFLDYINEKPSLTPFYSAFPTIENFENLIKNRRFSAENREILVETLKKQYENFKQKPDFDVLLNEKTFTVTTGHQLNIFTGPLYIIYKIVTTINLAKQLKATYPDYNFVPIYWMASEDHDFAEIASFNLFGKKYTWETAQTGAVGRMNPSELASILAELNEKSPIFEAAYLQSNTLADAVRTYMHELFGQYGLITIDADEAALKAVFAPMMQQDLIQQKGFSVVNQTTQKLVDLGYKTQISPREINLFYLDNQQRERIVQEGEDFVVQNTNLRFSSAEILALLASNPERFSPNVVMRPLYQEVILPNLAYIGGPSEVPYWLQLCDLFKENDVDFPALIPRNFALIVNEASAKKAEKIGITIEELFLDEVKLRKDFVEKNAVNSLSLATENESMTAVFEQILQKAILIDKTLEGGVMAERQKAINALENLEKRIKKAEERNQETAVSQLLTLKNKLFPEGGLQERKENFMNFYLNDPAFIQKLLDVFQPFDFKFNILK